MAILWYYSRTKSEHDEDINLFLPPDMADRVDAIMKQQGRPRSEFLRRRCCAILKNRSGDSFFSTERSGPGGRALALRTWPIWLKSTGPKSARG